MGCISYAQVNIAGFQKVNKTSQLGLKGEVKSYKVTPYEVHEHFGVVEKGNKASYWRGDVISIFDKQGMKIESERFDKSGQLLQKIFYKYNPAGNRMSRDTYNASGKVSIRHVYIYNEKGHPVACNGYGPTTGLIESYTYKTDEKGRIIEETCVKTTQPMCSTYKLVYEKDGKINSICVENKTTKDNSCEKYIYDKQGRLTQLEFSRKEGLIRKTIITYDDKGNEHTIKVFKADNTFLEEKEYTYKYDEKGNWIQRVEYINKFPKLILEREIIYY